MRKLCSKWVPRLLFHLENTACHKSIATMAKLHELHFELLPHPPYSPDLAPSDYYLFADLKRMLHGKRFDSSEAVIAKTKEYFEAKDKSFYKKGIEMFDRRWNECITLKGDYVDEKSRISPESYCFIRHPTNLLSDVR